MDTARVVKDVLRRDDVVMVKQNEPLKNISKLLIEKRISNVPIVNNKNELVGIVSEKDIIMAMDRRDFNKKRACDVMTKDVFFVKENDALEYVAKIFIEKSYRRIPVVKGNRIVGVVTRNDIINSFLSGYY